MNFNEIVRSVNWVELLWGLILANLALAVVVALALKISRMGENKLLEKALEDEDTLEMSLSEAREMGVVETEDVQPVNTGRHQFRKAILGIRPIRESEPSKEVSKEEEVEELSLANLIREPKLHYVIKNPRRRRVPVTV